MYIKNKHLPIKRIIAFGFLLSVLSTASIINNVDALKYDSLETFCNSEVKDKDMQEQCKAGSCDELGGLGGTVQNDCIAHRDHKEEVKLDFKPTEKQEQLSNVEAKNCGDSKIKTTILSGIACRPNSEGGPIVGVLVFILKIMNLGVGLAAVGGIGYAALLYTTAQNNASQTTKSILVITNVAVGIIAYATMMIVLNFIIPGGVM